MDNPIPRHHHLASPRAAAAFGALAFAGIGATIMAPQAFFIGAILSWVASGGVIYMYHPELLSLVQITYNREWNKIRETTDDIWLAFAIIAITALLPLLLYLIRDPITTNVTILFGRPTAQIPAIILKNLGSITAERAKYNSLLIDLDAPQVSDNNPMATAECEYIKAMRGCGPLTMTFNTNLSFPKGHRILGAANIDCLNCDASRSFWVFMHWQVDGWSSEIPNHQTIDLQKLMTGLPKIKENIDAFLSTINERTPFFTD